MRQKKVKPNPLIVPNDDVQKMIENAVSDAIFKNNCDWLMVIEAHRHDERKKIKKLPWYKRLFNQF